ncbi:hypothetical protein [Streptomyces sp. C10-9-1]|uniref:hypothetical protein n=1 Tax=Streptomyces sp. C10-9-1 TaxID=1859285 RepID=UPI003F49B654
MRVEMLRLMANPRLGTVQPGAIVEMDEQTAARRIAAGDCRPVDAPPPTQPDDSADGGGEVAVEDMTVDQLRAYAAAEGIDLDGATRKADVLRAVVAELERRRDQDEDEGT